MPPLPAASLASAPLKAAGFHKSGASWRRRLGGTVQVVDFQTSLGSSAVEKAFYVDVGLAFDAMAVHMGLAIDERPKEVDCDVRGTRDRLENLIEGVPPVWKFELDGDVDGLAQGLADAVRRLVAELDRIDEVAAYRRHPWFDRFRPVRANAVILYLLGERDAARREVQDLAVLFADRMNAKRPAWWLERLRLTDLAID